MLSEDLNIAEQEYVPSSVKLPERKNIRFMTAGQYITTQTCYVMHECFFNLSVPLKCRFSDEMC